MVLFGHGRLTDCFLRGFAGSRKPLEIDRVSNSPNGWYFLLICQVLHFVGSCSVCSAPLAWTGIIITAGALMMVLIRDEYSCERLG
jgi:hypothetical protein